MKKKLKEFMPLLNLVKEEKIRIIIASIGVFTVEIAELLVGYLNGKAVEEITKNNLKLSIIYLLLYLGLCLVFDVLVRQISQGELQKVESKVTRKLGYNTYVKALDLPAYAYEKTSSGEIINRINGDANTLSFAFLHILELVSSIIGSLIVLVYIMLNSVIIGIEILVFLIILFFILKHYNPLLIAVHKERKVHQDKHTTLINESIRGIREVKTLGIKDELKRNSTEINRELFNKSLKEIKLYKESRIIINTLKAFLEVGVFITCALLLYFGEVSLAFFIAMTYYVYRYMRLIENLNSFMETFQKTYVSISRVNEILTNKLYEDEHFGKESIDKVKGNITFENVTFNYPNEDTILKDFNLSIEPNKKIAIVGKSGQGKSTIFNLLTRVFDPVSGVIKLDDVDISSLSEDELRKNISIIRQEPFIFNRTILDNFKIVNKDITLKEVRKYCKEAYIDDYIMSLPQGYDTLLGEGGVNLSGGQKQRLSIARSLSKKSKVLLFDEATSALDNSSQEYIKMTIDELVKNHTIIIVAHRLSTIKDADIIYVMDKGKISAQGTHNYLLRNSKIYKTLYENEDTLNS
jgi:ATP-binding cassette subfamily B protein